MKLATLRGPGPDGTLVVVDRTLSWMTSAAQIAPTLQAALDRWSEARPALARLSEQLEAGAAPGRAPFDPAQAHSPLPRAYQWLDGSVYPAHMARMSAWRGVPAPPGPCLYQGGSDGFLAPTEPIPAVTEGWGVDFEAEVAVITSGLAYGADRATAEASIALVMICNDVSLRNLIPAELRKEFGFVQSKPASAFSPVACTPDELGPAWNHARLHLPLVSTLNDVVFGRPDAGPMEFGFDELLAYVAQTRSLAAGSIVGSGTVAGEDESFGFSCISEKRVVESLCGADTQTPFMRFGDRIRIEMFDTAGATVFGAIDQVVERRPTRNEQDGETP